MLTCEEKNVEGFFFFGGGGYCDLHARWMQCQSLEDLAHLDKLPLFRRLAKAVGHQRNVLLFHPGAFFFLCVSLRVLLKERARTDRSPSL